jgi:membrane dipeptidase
MIARIPPVPLSLVLDHIDHMVRVAGIDHVGALGSDFDGISATPSALEDVTRVPILARSLLDRGYSDSDVTKLLGGNVMRVMRESERKQAADSRKQ